MCGLFAALIVPVLLRWEKRCSDVRKWRAVSSRRIRLGLGREDLSQCGQEDVKCLSIMAGYLSFRQINGRKGGWNSSSLRTLFVFGTLYESLSSLSKDHYVIRRIEVLVRWLMNIMQYYIFFIVSKVPQCDIERAHTSWILLMKQNMTFRLWISWFFQLWLPSFHVSNTWEAGWVPAKDSVFFFLDHLI